MSNINDPNDCEGTITSSQPKISPFDGVAWSRLTHVGGSPFNDDSKLDTPSFVRTVSGRNEPTQPIVKLSEMRKTRSQKKTMETVEEEQPTPQRFDDSDSDTGFASLEGN